MKKYIYYIKWLHGWLYINTPQGMRQATAALACCHVSAMCPCDGPSTSRCGLRNIVIQLIRPQIHGFVSARMYVYMYKQAHVRSVRSGFLHFNMLYSMSVRLDWIVLFSVRLLTQLYYGKHRGQKFCLALLETPDHLHRSV